jgi:hypothetical protein
MTRLKGSDGKLGLEGSRRRFLTGAGDVTAGAAALGLGRLESALAK